MKKILAIIFLCFFTSCASDLSYRYYGNNLIASKKPSEVTILFDKPTKSFTAVADFQGRGSSSLIEEFRKRAADVGADAIIITSSEEDYYTSTVWAGSGIKKDKEQSSFFNRRIFGTAIIYKRSFGD